jgi:secreted PhoX family phosphatase
LRKMATTYEPSVGAKRTGMGRFQHEVIPM